MIKSNLAASISILSLCLLNPANAAKVEKRIPDTLQIKVTHTLIANAPMTTFNELKCEVIVLVALDYKTVKVMRIDPPSGKLNATYFVTHPEEIERHGIELSLDKELFLHGREIKWVQAQFDFENKQRDVVLTANFDDGKPVVKTRSIDAEFFRDHADHCLR